MESNPIEIGTVRVHDRLKEILQRTVDPSAVGLYYGDSPEMQSLVAVGLMEMAGRKGISFRVTPKGRELMQL